jgi:putative oxidoreductase
MIDILSLAQMGLNSPNVAIAVVRVATGGFFAISGFNKLFNPGRHASLKANLQKNHIPDVGFMQWWVPVWEFVGGILLTIGLFSAFAAFVLTDICIVACCCEARSRVEAYRPINRGDRIADYLYLPEVLYACLLIVPLLSGGGAYSVDALMGA